MTRSFTRSLVLAAAALSTLTAGPGLARESDPVAKADETFKVFVGVAAYRRLTEEFHGFRRVRFGEDGLSVH